MTKVTESTPTPITVDDLIQAGRSAHTARALAGAVTHFETVFDGSLPTTSDEIERYLVRFQTLLAPDTLRQRLALLASWHKQHGFPDPTKTSRIRDTLVGLRVTYAKPKKRAKPLSLVSLEGVIDSIEERLQQAALVVNNPRQQRALALTAIRDRCLVLIGFWCGFRGEQLVGLRVENILLQGGEGDEVRYMTLFVPKSKGDREAQGESWNLREMPQEFRHVCPLNAYLDWIFAAQLSVGPLFSKIDRWGAVWRRPLHINSLIDMLRAILRSAELPAEHYSVHSLRRGFANWAIDNNSSIHDLMSWVKWKDQRSVQPYLEVRADLPNRLLSANVMPSRTPANSEASTTGIALSPATRISDSGTTS